jgi:hypothetical protein
MPSLTSAQGFISLLQEDEAELQVYALKKLNDVVDQFWAEIGHDSISRMYVRVSECVSSQNRERQREHSSTPPIAADWFTDL